MTDWRTNFDEIDRQTQAELKRQETSAGLVASQRNPDQFARANALSDKTGLSPDLIHEDLPRFEQQDRDAGFKRLTDAHPELQGLASDARWRTLAQDQAPQLSAFADALKQAKRDRSPFATGTGTANDPLRVNKALGFGGKSSDFADVWNRAPEGVWVQREDGSIARRQIGMLEAAQGYALRGVAAAEKAVRSLPDVLALDAISGSLQAAEEAKARGDRYMNPYPAVSVGGLAPAIPNLHLQTPDQLAASAGAMAAREIPGVAAREAGRNRQVQQVQDQTQGMRPASVQALDRAQTTSETVGAIARHPIDTILSVGVESTVQFAPAIVAGLVSRNPAVVAAAAGSTSGALELSNGVSDFASRAGIDTNDPAAMRQFLQQGDNLKKALEYAKTRGAIIGSVDALTGPVGKYLHFSEQQIGHLAAREVANITAQTATQAAAGAGGEAAAQLATTGQVNGKDVVLEAVGELASTPGEVAGFAYDRVRTARDHQALQAVTAAAAETKLGERSLPDLESAARAVSGDQRVHLSADAARTLFQNDPAVLADMVGGDEALAEQMATGDLSIPMAKWAATVGRMPNAEELNRHARLDPDGISQAELERLDEEAAKFAGNTTDAASRATPAQPDSRQQVVDDVMGQLIATDRYSPAQAEAQAKVWGAAFGRFAERSGQDAFGLYQRYMAGIQNGDNAAIPAEPPASLKQSAIPPEADIEWYRNRVQQLETELRTDRLTGMRNQQAFEEDHSTGWGTVAAADMDGLKKLNDAVGHEQADKVLRALGAVLLASERDGVRFYRRSGDEFAARFQDAAVAEQVMREVQQKLENVSIDLDVADENGNIRYLTYNGIGLSYGTGNDYQSADTAANASKRDRLAAGIREEARANGQPRRLQPRAGVQGAVGTDQGSQRPADTRGLIARAADAVRSLFQPQQPEAPRGQINIFPDRRMSIQLFEKADRTTFLHESAHFFFEVMRDLATDENPEIKADFDALLSWFGVGNAEALTTDHLEQFARGFESYLGEGHAPSPELRSVFAKFAAWILGVYRSLKALNVELTDDVRAVFDRMLASDDEIEAAKSRQGMQPIARDASEAKALGLTDKQWADYLADVESAAEEARLDVFNQTIGALQREQRAWWKEERAKVRDEVAAKYEAMPAVRAKDVLSGKQSIGGVALEAPLLGLKLDKGAIVANWGDVYLKRLGKTYAVSGGVHPDEAAAMLGYASGDDLLRALANLPDTNARVDAETDAIMRERHGDPMTDGTLAEKAMDAVHGSKRIKVLERELALLSELAGTPPPPARIMRAIAERQVAGKTPRQLRPNDYLVAERRAAREALQAAAKKDFGAALKAKRQQALNVALYSAAREAQEQFGKDLRYLSRMSSTKTRAMLGKAGHDYLEQVDGLLEAVELRAASGPEVQRRQRLAEWVQRQEAAGNPVDVPVKLLAETGLTNIRDMAHADIRGVVSTIKQIEHLAKTKTRLTLAGVERDRDEVDAEMAASVLAAHGKVAERTGDPTRLERFKAGIADLDVGRLLTTNIARELDGYEEGGAVWSNVIAPIRTAMYEQVIPRIHKMQEAVADLYSKHYTKEELRRLDAPVWRESVGDHWSKGRILSLAMNWGSDGNREAILTQAKSRLTEAQALDLLRTLDARDWAFVQGMVDMINDFWPEIAETQRRRTGLVPEKVESKSFAIQGEDGAMHVVRGGYFPLKYDAERSGYGATLNELDDKYNALRVGRTAKAATRNGHTLERVGSGGKTVLLGLDIATSHMRDVIRDIHLGDAVAYVHNVLHGSQFADAVIGAGKRQHLKALEVWLKDVAAGELGARSPYEKVLRMVRMNWTAAVLTYKPVSAMLQVSGIVQTGSIIGNKAALHGVLRLLSKSWHGPNSVWNDIREKSAFMRERFGQIPDAVEAVQSQRAGALSAAHSAMIRWGYVPMARVQMIADAATWLAGERVGLKKFDGDVDKARAFADDLVQRAQSPESFFEKSAISRGTLNENLRQTEIVKASTMLLSYMIAKGNVAREKYQATSFTSPMQVTKFTLEMVQLFAVEAMISSLVRGGLPDDDDDDGVADDWFAYITKEVSLGYVSTIPMLAQLATAGRGYTPQSVMDRSWEALKDAAGAWFDGNIDREDVKGVVTISGLATGAPSSQINTTADALWRVHDGQDVSPLDFAVRQEKKN